MRNTRTITAPDTYDPDTGVCTHNGQRTRLSGFGTPQRVYDLCENCGLIVAADGVDRPVERDPFFVTASSAA